MNEPAYLLLLPPPSLPAVLIFPRHGMRGEKRRPEVEAFKGRRVGAGGFSSTPEKAVWRQRNADTTASLWRRQIGQVSGGGEGGEVISFLP